MKLFKNVKLN